MRALVLAVFLGAAVPGLSGCTLTPVYGNASVVATRLALVYPDPHSRLEQIVYHALQPTFPPVAPGSGAPGLSASVSAGGITLSQSRSPDIASTHRVRVTARVTLSRPGQPDVAFTRFAEADYNTVSQVSADIEAERDAEERAARAVAEDVRLALLGLLSPA